VLVLFNVEMTKYFFFTFVMLWALHMYECADLTDDNNDQRANSNALVMVETEDDDHNVDEPSAGSFGVCLNVDVYIKNKTENRVRQILIMQITKFILCSMLVYKIIPSATNSVMPMSAWQLNGG
jgi:hypothetical protein